MAERIRSSIELYDGRRRGKRLVWRLGAVLYHANSLPPEQYGHELEALVEEACMALKSSEVRYWYNSLRFAATLITRSVEGEDKLPRLLPCIALRPTSDYLYRVLLGPEEQISVHGYRVVHGQSGLIESLMPLEIQEPAS